MFETPERVSMLYSLARLANACHFTGLSHRLVSFVGVCGDGENER